MKIIHTPFNIGNQASVLSRAEKRRLGENPFLQTSISAVFSPDTSIYPADKVLSGSVFYQNSNFGKLLNSLKIFLYGLTAIKNYDTFHFYFGRSFLSFGIRVSFPNFWDMWFLKKIGKTVFLTYQGCDARQRTEYYDNPVSACKPTECAHAWCSVETDQKRKINILKARKYCDKIFCLNPDLIPLVEDSEFLPYTTLFPEDFSRISQPAIGKTIRIIHAPTDRHIKGTKYIEHAVNLLKKKYDIAFILIEDKPQKEVFELYRTSDILIDQLLVGWYGSTAVEGMANGLPVISFINREFLRYIPQKMADEIPVVSADPTNLYFKLEQLINSPEKRNELAEKGRAYLRRWHNPDKIAAVMLELYHDPSKKFWNLYSPE